MPALSRLAAACIDLIRVNAVGRSTWEGRPIWTKRRRVGAELLLACSNGFFRLAGSPMRTIVSTDAWQAREIDSFRLLHGSHLAAGASDTRTVFAEELPGINLTVPLDSAAITPKMTAAAGRELRRAHSCRLSDSGSFWSHGDAHLGNFMYDAENDRAWIIDFEVEHAPELGNQERHIDDVVVFLQDMAGRIAAPLWPECARAFLTGYGDLEMHSRVLAKLAVPGGVARLWWAIRTGFLPMAEWKRRISELQALL